MPLLRSCLLASSHGLKARRRRLLLLRFSRESPSKRMIVGCGCTALGFASALLPSSSGLHTKCSIILFLLFLRESLFKDGAPALLPTSCCLQSCSGTRLVHIINWSVLNILIQVKIIVAFYVLYGLTKIGFVFVLHD